MDGDAWSESRAEIKSLKDRIAELEDCVRKMKAMNVNLLTVLKEYAGMILKLYSDTMGQADAEKAALDLTKKYDFKGGEN